MLFRSFSGLYAILVFIVAFTPHHTHAHTHILNRVTYNARGSKKYFFSSTNNAARITP